MARGIVDLEPKKRPPRHVDDLSQKARKTNLSPGSSGRAPPLTTRAKKPNEQQAP